MLLVGKIPTPGCPETREFDCSGVAPPQDLALRKEAPSRNPGGSNGNFGVLARHSFALRCAGDGMIRLRAKSASAGEGGCERDFKFQYSAFLHGRASRP